MTPAPAQPQPPQPTSPAITAPTVSPPPKSRLLLYLAGGFILLIIIAVISLEIVLPLLRQKTPPPDFQDQPIRLADTELVEFVKTKFNISPESLISIEKIEGDYAWGTASTAADGAGFYWATAKTNGEWSYVFGGNGIPDCNEVEVFPPTVFDGKFDTCYNETRKETIYRPTGEKL